ncbi:hypothetical protein STENM327S_06782 [Streptomyces tendae]
MAASDSEWKEVSAIQAMGRKKTMPTSQATRPRPAPVRRLVVRAAWRR